jgi:hypothetical protein
LQGSHKKPSRHSTLFIAIEGVSVHTLYENETEFPIMVQRCNAFNKKGWEKSKEDDNERIEARQME